MRIFFFAISDIRLNEVAPNRLRVKLASIMTIIYLLIIVNAQMSEKGLIIVFIVIFK